MILNYQPLTDIPSKMISIKLFYPEVSGLIPKLLFSTITEFHDLHQRNKLGH